MLVLLLWLNLEIGMPCLNTPPSCILLLFFCLLCVFTLLGYLYSTQCCQGWGNYKGTDTQQLANTYKYTFSEVACAITLHKVYNTTVLGVYSRVQWDKDSCVH